MSPESGSRELVTERDSLWDRAQTRATPLLEKLAEFSDEEWAELTHRMGKHFGREMSDRGLELVDRERIESEAVSRFAEALRTAVEGLRGHPVFDEGEGRPQYGDLLDRAAVLSEIERLSQAPADTGEGA